MATQAITRPAEPAAGFPGRYLRVTSFKRDGTGVATPVWFVADGDRLLALTDAGSAKVRRIRRDPHVLVAACRPDGRLRGPTVAAHAQVLTAAADLDRAARLLRKRYKISYPLVMALRGAIRRVRRRPGLGEGAVLAITPE
jgi:PPOX class probable F420-dependent enzyme